MSKRDADRNPEPTPSPRRAHVIVIWEDTADDGPRTWSVASGLVDPDAVDLVDHVPCNNSGIVRAFALRYIEEMDLLGGGV